MKHLINGRYELGEGAEMTVYNPANGEVIKKFKGASKEQALRAAEGAEEAFKTWSKLSLNERERYILKYAEVLEAHREEIIDLLIQETGKPYHTAAYDFDMIPNCLRFFNDEAKRLNGQIIPDYDGGHMHLIVRKPIGVIVGYLAWNFPLLNVGYKLGPALASGCTCILKPASITPLATLYVASLAEEAGIPKGVVNVVAGNNRDVCNTLNESTIPSMLTLIGSSATGRKIIEQSATSVKHFSLELGGNAPVVVFSDADIKKAALATADGKFGNCGQVCVAPNRVFVHEVIHQTFLDEVKKFVDHITLGAGKDEAEFLMGPVSSEGAVDWMEGLVADAVEKGATVVCGGKRAARDGYYFEPTVLADVTPEMRVYQEEIFGPIMPILTFNDEDDIVAMANDTEYGLAAYVYTNDFNTAMHMGTAIDSGSVCINEPFYQYNLPHGGCKESGVGKDCSTFSLEEYYYVQRVTFKR